MWRSGVCVRHRAEKIFCDLYMCNMVKPSFIPPYPHILKTVRQSYIWDAPFQGLENPYFRQQDFRIRQELRRFPLQNIP